MAAPVTFDVEYTEARNRLSTGLRMFYALPHVIVVSVLMNFAQLVAVLQWFLILFRGRRDRSLWQLTYGVLDWNARVNAYSGLLFDTYPEFGFQRGKEPVTFGMAYEEQADRLTCGLRFIWIIPAAIVGFVLSIGLAVVTIVSWFAILFLGRHSRTSFTWMLKVHRYLVRVQAYGLLLTDTYPKYE